MTRDGAVPPHGDAAAVPPGDLLVQAVEGMARPLFVLDGDWLFRYMNAAGARVLDRTVGDLIGRHIWAEFPDAIGSTFEELYRGVRESGRSGSTEAWFEPLGRWFRADAFLTDAGLVVTYDDVTERRRTEDERAAAAAAREVAAEEAARAASDAEQAGRHLMLLGDINLAMTSTLDTDTKGARRDVGRAHSDPAMVEAMHRYADARVSSNRASAPVPMALRSGRPVVIPELTPAHIETMVSDEVSRAALAPLRVAAVAAFPLVARGETFGALTLVNGPERGAHTADELRTAEIASRRAALALDNARLAAANQQVAERLQLSLLSPPVQLDDLELAVRYRPATRGVSIGGDWYDSFLQPDGDAVLVIGDVMGHDIEAAAAMGQVKTLVRGIAFDRLEEPAGVLRRVDHAMVGLAVPTLATALVARIEQSPAGLRRLRWATAGHPEPMLLDADGVVVDLSAPVGPPLGIGWLGPRADGQVLMPEGSTLLLFTDGLFERRGVPLDESRAQLRDLLAASAGLSLDELCDRLLGQLLGKGAEDDVAVLAVRAHAPDLERRTQAGPELVPPALPVP
jgi:serine phosphatase RsbU (regulator of sigma subunit)